MEQHKYDEIYMRRCLTLSKKGGGRVAPNPMVGAVIVHNNKIIAEGFHKEYGGEHAEPMAIQLVTDPSILQQSTLYVSLEPCSHHGKTPPCTNIIIESKIPRVVIATLDPNPLMAGSGIKKMQDAGIDVTVGVLEKEAKYLNRRFFVYHTLKRPYVILKWAQTLDGYIDPERDPDAPIAPVWITNELARTVVHRWRSQEQSIVIGSKTVEKDNPRLDVRQWRGSNPLRIVLDRTLRLPKESHVYDGSTPTMVIIGNNSSAANRKPEFLTIPNLEIVVADFAKGLESRLLQELYERDITSLIVEGGAKLLQSFIQRGFWDEARVFVGNKFFDGGTKAPEIKGKLHCYDEFGDSCLFTYRNPQIKY